MKNLKSILNSNLNAFNNLLKKQKLKKLKEGCYVYELEADTTIPSEYILLMHYLGRIDVVIQEKMINYIIGKQNSEGGWPLFFN